MRRIIPILVIAFTLACISSCNEKPKSYKFVKRAIDGTEQIETISAKNDTDALNMYLDRMSSVIMESIEKKEAPFEAMFVISPEGDTLNTNKELLEYVSKSLPSATPDTIQLGVIPAKK